MYSHLDLNDIPVPKLPPIKIARRRSSARYGLNSASQRGAKATPLGGNSRPAAELSVTSSPAARRTPPSPQPQNSTSPISPTLASSFGDKRNLQNSGPLGTTVSSGQRRRSLAGEGSPSIPATPASGFFVVDKPPKVMKMDLGDHYFIPISCTSLRIELQPEVSDPTVTPELIVSAYSSIGKRLYGVSRANRATKDRSLQHLGDEWALPGHCTDSVLVNLASVLPEAAFVWVIVNAPPGRVFAEDDTFHIRVIDTGFFPGNPELFHTTFTPNRQKISTCLSICFVQEKWVGPGGLTPQTKSVTTSSIQKSPAPSTSVANTIVTNNSSAGTPGGVMWTAKTVTTFITHKPQKQIVAEVEELCKRLHGGYIPVPKGEYQSGGDPSRIVGVRMLRKAQKVAGSPSDNNSSRPSGSSSEDDAGSLRESLSTETPVDPALEDFEQLFMMKGGPRAPGQGRPRVVRRNRCTYSVGKASTIPEQKKNDDSDEAYDSDDDELFRQAFADFASRRVIRYDDRCYNIGTDKDLLLKFYLANRDELESTICGSAVPRAPLAVECVFDDRADDDSLNIGDPPALALDDGSGMGLRHVPSGSSIDGLIVVSGGPRSGSLFAGGNRSSMSAEAIVNFHADNDVPVVRTSDVRLPRSSVQRHSAYERRFGPLKPPMPLDIKLLRENQERLRREEAERRSREEARLRGSLDRRGTLSATAGSTGAAANGTKSRGASANPVKISPNKSGKGPRRPATGPQRTRRPRPMNFFSGELMQWIDAYIRKEVGRSPLRNGSPPEKEAPLRPTTITPPSGPPHVLPIPPALAPGALSSRRPSTTSDPVLSSEIVSPVNLTPAAAGKKRSSIAIVIQEPQSEEAVEV